MAEERRAELLIEHLAKGEEVGDAASLGGSKDVRPNTCQNSRFTCLVVSIRNPSTPNSSIQKA